MSETALSTVGFDYRAAYTGEHGWRGPDRSNTLQNVESDDSPWPVDRHEVTFEVHAATAACAWFQRAVDDLVGLINLGPNWNGYGERPVHPASAKRLVGLLDEMGFRGAPASIVPLPDGGVQAEWHRGEASVEIEVPPVGDARAYATGLLNGDDDWVANRGEGLKVLAADLRELLGG